MLRITNILLLATFSQLSISCASYSEKYDINEPGATDVILCEEPRPQICTREYKPVCATLQDGSSKTYATGCTSCSDSSVKSYQPGECV